MSDPRANDDATEAADADVAEPDAAERAGIPNADDAMAGEVYDGYISDYEERLAQQRLSSIEAGRRKGGIAGAAMAGAMTMMSEIIEGPKKDDKPVTVEASSDPDDVDRDGIRLEVGEFDVEAPPLERIDPVVGDDRKRPQV